MIALTCSTVADCQACPPAPTHTKEGCFPHQAGQQAVGGNECRKRTLATALLPGPSLLIIYGYAAHFRYEKVSSVPGSACDATYFPASCTWDTIQSHHGTCWSQRGCWA